MEQAQRIPKQNETFLVGTFASNNISTTAQGTSSAARALWHFAQAFFQEFPTYKPNDNSISIWTESYGGKYGPAFTSFFQQQNEKILNGSMAEPNGKFVMKLDTLGIINGCIDDFTQGPSYAQMAYNNTYGIQAINETAFQNAVAAWDGPHGCKSRIITCRELAKSSDPDNLGINSTVNSACKTAAKFCQ
jgi:carboxypeptidase C (cathepsin A)